MWLYNSKICMSGIYTGYRKEKPRHERVIYRSCMLGWSKEMGEGIFAGKNGFLYIMSKDRPKSPLLISARSRVRGYAAFSFLRLWNMFDQTLPNGKKYRHGILRTIKSLLSAQEVVPRESK